MGLNAPSFFTDFGRVEVIVQTAELALILVVAQKEKTKIIKAYNNN